MRSEQLNDLIDERYGSPDVFRNRVKRSLWDSGISQAALAREAGHAPSTVNRWLNGKKTPSLQSMLILDEALERLLEDTLT